jgi:HK97 family phage portal protein
MAGWLSRLFGRSSSPAPRAAVQSASGGRLVTTSAELEEALRGSSSTASGAHVTPDRSMHVAAVFACVRIITGAVATMPLNIKRRVDARTREDAADHPVSRLVRRAPNAWMTPSAFRRMLTAHVLLRGNAYALKVKSAGKVVALIPMHPDRVVPRQASDNSIAYVYTRPDGGTITLPKDEVFHLIGLTLDGLNGVSVIRYAREAVGVALQTEKHGAKVFENGASLGLHFEHPTSLSAQALDNLKTSLEQFRGAENAHRMLITEEGMKINRVGMTMEDAQYIATRQFTRGEIAMFFGVPPHMIGDTEKSTSWGTGIEQQSLGFVAYTLQDWLTAWEETINRDLIAEDDVFARFNTAGLVRGDIKTRYQAYALGRQWGFLSANDIRNKEDENPIEGGDTYFEPLNMAAAGTNGDTTQ